MKKSKVHKETISGTMEFHLCKNRTVDNEGRCCSRFWKNVTCPKCLKLRRKK